jgi:hypothetical protein
MTNKHHPVVTYGIKHGHGVSETKGNRSHTNYNRQALRQISKKQRNARETSDEWHRHYYIQNEIRSGRQNG